MIEIDPRDYWRYSPTSVAFARLAATWRIGVRRLRAAWLGAWPS